MKTFLLFVFAGFLTVASSGQGIETFSNVPSIVNSYASFSWTGDNGLQWSATDARTDTTLDGSKCVAIRVGAITCNNIPNGCSSLSFKYKQVFSGSGGVVEVRINGTLLGSYTISSTTQTATINNINVSGNFNLEIKQTTSSQRVRIDDVSWTALNTAPCTTPSAQPSNLTFGATNNSSISASFTEASPAPNQYLVLISNSNSLTASPQNGTDYSEGDVIGNATVVTETSATAFTAGSLSQGTTYYFYIFSDNNACTGGPLYNTTSPLTGSAATTIPPACVAPAAMVGALTLNPANTSVSGSFAAAADADAYLVVRSTSSTLSFSPVNGTTYSGGQTVGNGSETVVKFDSVRTFFSTGLTNSTTYYFYVFAANNYSCAGGPTYNTASTSGSATTTNGGTGEPTGYYSTTTGKNCSDLKTTLKTIISTGVTPKTYGDLWDIYKESDIKPREVGSGSANVIWDIYSDNPTGTDPYNFTPGTQQCGGYSGEGECYNREHSVPLSWFNGSTSNLGTATDYLHIFPTDGKVNAIRSNYIYGEVATASYTSSNGSKLGSSAVAGFTTDVFEPINEYKGDVARAFLYFVTRYQDNMPGWPGTGSGTQAFDPTTYPSVDLPYLQLMIKWSHEDPVSQKEIDRNNAAYVYQGNRNPYIDHPEYVDMVWNSSCPGLTALPVDIIYFSGKLVADKVMLEWTAANELNFDRFEIERSINGTSYFKIGEVKAANIGHYNFNDDASLLKGQRVYYRLKKVDKDGNFKYSEVFTLHIPLNTKFSIYPNPASSAIQLKMNSNVNGNVMVEIADITGKVLQQKTFTVNGNNIEMTTAGLSSGTYLVKLQYNGDQYLQKLIVSK